MTLEHRRLIRPGKKIRPNFFSSTSLLYKILPTNLGVCKPTFIPFKHHIWGDWNNTMRHCFYHTDLGQNAVFHKFAIIPWKCIHSIFRTYICPAVVVFDVNMNRVTLQHNKEFIMVIFYRCACNLQKRLIRAAFWVLPKAVFTEWLKTNGTAIKITRETTNNQKWNIIRWNIYRDNNLHSRRQVLQCLKILTLQA